MTDVKTSKRDENLNCSNDTIIQDYAELLEELQNKMYELDLLRFESNILFCQQCGELELILKKVGK